MSGRIYLDNSATTPIAPEVLEAMLPHLREEFGNPSSLHTPGQIARAAIDRAREEIAGTLDVSPSEIVFTGGATEANNLAIKGLAFSQETKRHLVTSRVEHPAVLRTCEWLAQRGYDLTVLDVDATGRVDPQDLRGAIRDETFLVSIMAGNNEIGTLEPIATLAEICAERGVAFHTDAVQAYGKVPLALEGVSLLSASAHKLHGPKGVGFLYVRRGTTLTPILHGGGHERGLRSGTENTAGIVGLGRAAALAFGELDTVPARMRRLRERLISAVMQIPATRLNGHRTESLPHIANFSFQGIEGESLIMRLDERGIAASTGSACSSPDLEPSHVLLAIGVPLSMAHGSLRISTGRQTTPEEIERLIQALPPVVDELRAISPFKVGDPACTPKR